MCITNEIECRVGNSGTILFRPKFLNFKFFREFWYYLFKFNYTLFKISEISVSTDQIGYTDRFSSDSNLHGLLNNELMILNLLISTENDNHMLRTPDLGDPPVAEITHPFHPHKLRLADNVTDGHWPFRCGGCKELAAGRRRYRCEPCDLTLYTCCATAPLTLEHPLLPGRHFRLLERPPPPPPWLAADDRGGGGWRPACDACGDLLRGDGFAYHCADGHGLVGLNLHPRCARLRLPVAAARGAAAVKLCRRAAPRRRCGVCMSGEDGYRHGFWTCRFRRSGGDELVDVHLSCLKELMSHSHETLTNLYEILMEDGTPTNDCGEGTSAQDNSRCVYMNLFPPEK